MYLMVLLVLGLQAMGMYPSWKGKPPSNYDIYTISQSIQITAAAAPLTFVHKTYSISVYLRAVSDTI